MRQIFPFFSKNPLNRLDHTRRDEGKCKELQSLETSRFLLFFDGQLLASQNEWYFSKEILLTCKYNQNEIILLGVEEETHYFCVSVKEYPKNINPVNLREFCINVKEEKLGILAQANAVINWHETHAHCSFCGEKTVMAHAGWRRDCKVCKKEHFPRTDPVVMMLVTNGDYCLLGRGVHFPPNRYSSLAGYMESGESIEDAARRELFEEAGIIGGDVSYITSQPWPFPYSLMIGLHVKAKTTEITMDKEELEDVRWVHKDDIKAILSGDERLGIKAPIKLAIARNLLEYWVC